MKKKELTFNAACRLMDRRYRLINVDDGGSLNGHPDLIRQCIAEKSDDELRYYLNDWFIDAEDESAGHIVGELKDRCISSGFGKPEVEKFFSQYGDSIRNEIYRRDDSDLIGDLLKNTADIPVRIELHSGYDCINSHRLESQEGYCYEQSYFGDMVDALMLNPAKVQKLLLSHGCRVYGPFPGKACRDGRELVGYEDFYRELLHSRCGANLLVFTGKINPPDLYRNSFAIDRVTIPKGNYCGLFSSLHGGGSVLEMELQQDAALKLHAGKHDYYGLQLDCREGSDSGYSIRETYGVDMSFFRHRIKITN